jgi:3-methyl-2-oxobutanoate hydroxymethyltransferase
LAKKANSIILGIGAGRFVHGQLLILHDLLGLYPSFRPKFAKCYVPDILPKFSSFLNEQSDLITFGRATRRDGLYEITRMAVSSYISDVRNSNFPDETFSYKE